MATRLDPRAHDAQRRELRRRLEEPAEISIAIMPASPEDLAALAKATGLSINAVRALIKIAAEGGPKAAGAAVMREAEALFALGRSKMNPKAIRTVIHNAYNEVISKAHSIRSRLTTAGELNRAESLGDLASAPRVRVPKAPKAAPAAKAPGAPSMDPHEAAAQNKAVEKFAREKLAELPKDPVVEPSPMVRARKKVSPRAQAAREERAWKARDAATEEAAKLKDLEAAGKQGDKMPPKSQDALGRRHGSVEEAERRAGAGFVEKKGGPRLGDIEEVAPRLMKENPGGLDWHVKQIERETQELRNVGKLPGFEKGYLRRTLSQTRDALTKGDKLIGPHEKVAALPPDVQTKIADLIHNKQIRLVPRPPIKK